MLDSAFNLKIADFGFAAPTEGRNGSGMLETQLGTSSYMAPEIHLGKPYSGPSVDLFAAAIILFVILTQRPPFSTADPNDPHYRLLAANRADIFWLAHLEADDGVETHSPEFKDLFEKMMAINPCHRLSIEDIFAHPWMRGEFATKAAIKTEFQKRKNIVDADAKKGRDEKRQQRAQAANGRTRRSSSMNIEAEMELQEMIRVQR